jgi:hypothetical protein
MPAAALKHDPLSLLGDGVVASSRGRTWPIPLASTEIGVEIVGGLAVVRTVRRFRNAEDKAIEATMTFPVPGDSALTGLRATIDGRDLVASAQPSVQARQTYEAALDDGKTAILHEEKLRGVHMLSLGNLAPGKEAEVTLTFVAPLSFASSVPTLRIPTSVGEIFGRSPLIASDDLVTGPVTLVAKVRVGGHGSPQVLGTGLAEAELPLDGSIVVAVPAWTPVPAAGRSADGSAVTVTVDRLSHGDAPLDLAVVFDRSGSTRDPMQTDTGRTTAWEAMRNGLRHALGRELRAGDRVRVYDYGTNVVFVGEATGPDALALVERISAPSGGTETGIALTKAMSEHEGDVLLLTDGRSHAVDVGTLAARGRRVTAILVGNGALDAHVGHLAALTGGQLFVCPGDMVNETALAALASLRIPSRNAEVARASRLPSSLRADRGGASVEVSWGEPSAGTPADDVGRYAAALAIPGLDDAAATRVAVEHGLCTHLTSLVMVDEAGEVQKGIPATRKVPLMASASRGFGGGAVAAAFASAASQGMGMMRSALRSASPRLSGMESGSLSVERSMAWSTAPSPAPEAPSSAPGFSLRTPDAGNEAGRVDWDTLAPRVEELGVKAIPAAARVVIAMYEGLDEVIALAKALGKDVWLVAVALLASGAKGNRTAGRLARSVLKGAPEAELKAALKAVGL